MWWIGPKRYTEFARVGLDLPDVDVLDTMGRLARHVDVRPATGHLDRCSDDDRCPSCETHQPCPLDYGVGLQ